MTHYWYLIALVGSFLGVLFYDIRHTGVIRSGRKALVPIFAAMALLILSDIAGIYLNIFHTNPSFVSGLFIGTPDMPIEELVLLFFLPYFTLVLHKSIRIYFANQKLQ